MSPVTSDDLTEVIVPGEDGFVLMQSSEKAEHQPGYVEVAQFASLGEAKAYLGGDRVT
jgi:hypothetical protein